MNPLAIENSNLTNTAPVSDLGALQRHGVRPEPLNNDPAYVAAKARRYRQRLKQSRPAQYAAMRDERRANQQPKEPKPPKEKPMPATKTLHDAITREFRVSKAKKPKVPKVAAIVTPRVNGGSRLYDSHAPGPSNYSGGGFVPFKVEPFRGVDYWLTGIKARGVTLEVQYLDEGGKTVTRIGASNGVMFAADWGIVRNHRTAILKRLGVG